MRRALLVLGLLACEHTQDSIALARAVQAQFKQPARIMLTSSGELAVTLPYEPMEKIPQADRQTFAKRVARFAYAHYAHPDQVHLVTVSFAGDDPDQSGQWEPAELTDASTPAAVAHASRQVVWVAIGDRNAPARIDVDESRLDHGSGDTPEEIFVRVLYDSAVTAPSGQIVPSVEIHYRVTCSTAISTMLGVEAYDRGGKPVLMTVFGDSLPAWMEPHGVHVQRSALKGYCRVFYPGHHFAS